MKKKMKIILLIGLAVALLLTGCGPAKNDVADIEFTDNYGNSYPIKTDETLTVWCEFPETAMTGARNLNDLPLAKQIEKETGIKVEYIHPTDQTGESFNLMLASGELPDIIFSRWCNFAGGGDKAVSDGYILPLNEIIDKYAPDFNAALDEYDARKFFSTDDGQMFFFPGLWDSEAVNTAGFMLRQDWLDELGLEVPETIDEWENVLTQFRDKKGATAPFTSTKSVFFDGGFSGAYGIKLDYFIDNGKIKNGFAEPVYKDLLSKMIEWRDAGLIDKELSSSDTGTIITKMLTEKSGAVYGAQGSTMGNLEQAATNPNFELVPAPFPSLEKGVKCNMAKQQTQAVTQMGGAITTQCKDVELAARWLNYGYTKQGRLTYAFGIEGESYEMIDGVPTYTEYVTNNPDGVSMKNMLDRYTRSATSSGSFVKAYGYLIQYAKLPQQKAALEIWSDSDGEPRALPPLFFKDEEQKIVSEKLGALKTYQDEMFAKFLNKNEPLDKFDEYLKTLDELGNKEILEIYQSAYERYLNR